MINTLYCVLETSLVCTVGYMYTIIVLMNIMHSYVSVCACVCLWKGGRVCSSLSNTPKIDQHVTSFPFSGSRNVGRFSSYIDNPQVLHSVGKICKLWGRRGKGGREERGG